MPRQEPGQQQRRKPAFLNISLLSRLLRGREKKNWWWWWFPFITIFFCTMQHLHAQRHRQRHPVCRAPFLVAALVAGCHSAPYHTGLSPAITGAVCDVTDHGAVADNTTLSTLFIQRAINHCSTNYPAGSTVVVPKGPA